MSRCSVNVVTTLGKDELMHALRELTIDRAAFDPGPWSVADAEDLERAARLIRREVAGAKKGRAP
jgi:hypothetical protein